MKTPQESEENCSKPVRGEAAPAFLLAQVGAHAAAKFAERLGEAGLVPADAGILRILAATPAITQQALATKLGTLPSRLVAMIDDLESRGLVERHADESDRRRYALRLTEKGTSLLQTIGLIAREHRRSLLAALSNDEQRQLANLLQRVADEQGLTRGVHPGFAGGRAGAGKVQDQKD
jgi:DNA-binding MarR family transcriptional regulator